MIKDQLQVLLFEKDESVGKAVCELMQMGNFGADLYTSADEAKTAYEKKPCPICIISFETPYEREGFQLARAVKSKKQSAILIFMCTNPTIQSIAEAYTIGADDFIRKPFIMEELQMRIKAIVRRTEGVKHVHPRFYNIGKYRFNTIKQTLAFECNTVKITTKESELLMFLCENINNTVFREDILKNVWKRDTSYNARSMDVYITKLRVLLREDRQVGIINVHGKGYKLLVLEDE